MPRKRWFDRFHLRVAKLLTKRLMIGMFAALFLLVYCLRSRVMAQTQDVVLVGAADIGGCGPAPSPSRGPAGFLGFIPRTGFVAGGPLVSTSAAQPVTQHDQVA